MLSSETRISFHPLLLLLEIFLKPSCSFQTWMDSNLPPHLQIKGSRKWKVLPRCGRKKAQSDLVILSLSLSLSLSLWLCITCLFCFFFFFWVSLVLYFVCFFMFLFGCFSAFVYFAFQKKLKNTKTMFVCVYWFLCTLDGNWNKVF